jgi:hypothetical protein
MSHRWNCGGENVLETGDECIQANQSLLTNRQRLWGRSEILVDGENENRILGIAKGNRTLPVGLRKFAVGWDGMGWDGMGWNELEGKVGSHEVSE